MRSDNQYTAFDVVLSTVLAGRESHLRSRVERANLESGVVDGRLGRKTKDVEA